MSETFVSLPVSFWVTLGLLLGGCLWAGGKIRAGIGLPMMAVLVTVTVWYVVDLFYNDYHSYSDTFSSDTLSNAWWQVDLFLTFFFFFAPLVHQLINARYLQQTSSAYRMFRTGVGHPTLQQQLNSLLRGCVLVWLVLALIAAIRLGHEVPYYFFPFLDHKADPWLRNRLGSGIDSLLSLAGYLQLFASAAFGIVAALANTQRVRSIAILGCVFAWPYYIFDRTRNSMLTLALPAILTWTLLRLRGWWVKKVIVLAGFFFLVTAWFGFVIANRASMSITDALSQKGFNLTSSASVHHQGLNMYEELCWINALMTDQLYQPNWGALYLAEVVSFVPRAVWPDKPASSLDYAVARGQDATSGATISTGMIGQGVVNFGRVLGPAFAALLMSVWTAVLARLDLRGRAFTLYGLGLVLTFNLGRDVTLITLYTFVFGALVIWCMNRYNQMTAHL